VFKTKELNADERSFLKRCLGGVVSPKCYYTPQG